jgi:hypothetical protein
MAKVELRQLETLVDSPLDILGILPKPFANGCGSFLPIHANFRGENQRFVNK